MIVLPIEFGSASIACAISIFNCKSTVLFIIFVGFVFACFNTKRRSDNGWGIDMDFSSFGSSSDSGGDGGD